VKTITKKALHHLGDHQLVSMQEAVHMVDEQELVICSDSMIYVSITQGHVLRDEQETDKTQDIITVYQNRPKKYKDLSLEQFFYCIYINTTFRKSKNGDSDDNDERDAIANNEHRILIPKGMNCIPRYTVDYDYA
jgi:hypothetical protein